MFRNANLNLTLEYKWRTNILTNEVAVCSQVTILVHFEMLLLVNQIEGQKSKPVSFSEQRNENDLMSVEFFSSLILTLTVQQPPNLNI